MIKKEARTLARTVWEEFLSNDHKRNLLLQNLVSFLKENQIKEIFAFYPVVGREPPILEVLIHRVEKIFLPVIEDATQRIMNFYIFKNSYELKQVRKNAFGIFEPVSKSLPSIPDRNSYILIPTLSTNVNYARLGNGWGFYDRFITKCPEAIKIGLLPEILTKIDFKEEIHDLILDIIITENNIVYKTNTKNKNTEN